MNKESKLCPDFFYIYKNNKLIDFKFIKDENNKETSGKEKAKIYK